MGRIVVGVDGSPSSVRAFLWAVREAQRRGDVLVAVSTWDSAYPDMWVPSEPPGADHLAPFRHQLDRLVHEVVGTPPSVPVETVVVDGPPAQALLAQAEDADLLVVGNRGRGGFARALLGSVGRHCVAHAACPVVVVRGLPEAA